jgi:hypothetical protein
MRTNALIGLADPIAARPSSNSPVDPPLSSIDPPPRVTLRPCPLVGSESWRVPSCRHPAAAARRRFIELLPNLAQRPTALRRVGELLLSLLERAAL